MASIIQTQPAAAAATLVSKNLNCRRQTNTSFCPSSGYGSLSWSRAVLAADSLLSLMPPSPRGIGGYMKPVITCTARTAPVTAANLAPATPVRPTSILVVGAPGTLGRQVVRRALDEGYDVRYLVRPRPAPADFLRDWGAIVVNADLTKPETIPATLVGVHTIIDCATGRPEKPIKTIGKGKLLLYNVQKQWASKSTYSFLFITVTNILKFH